MIAPRLLTKDQAAEYCGLKPAAFSKWVRAGRLPRRIFRTQRWDKVAIDRALDRLSGVAPSKNIATADEFLRRYDEPGTN